MSRSEVELTTVAASARRTRGVIRRPRRTARGQSLAIFAISALVLFGIAGLAVDTGLSYLAAGRMERAASAGALAGVTYMPDQYSPNAINAANAAVQRNGYVNGVAGATVSVFKVPIGCGGSVPCATNRLGVTVSTTVSNTFIRLLGFGASHTVTQQATAEFLPTLTLGQPDPHLGATAQQINSNPVQGYYFLRTEAWGTPRSEGDAYTPNPASASGGSTSDVHTLNSTNDAQLGGGTAYPGFDTLPDRGGYSYQITVPASGTSHPRVQVYNATFAPNDSNDYKERDSTFDQTKAQQFAVMEYTLFRVVDQFDHSKDIPLSQMYVNPIDATGTADTTQWIDSTTQKKFTDTTATGTVSSFYHQWIDPTLPQASYPDAEQGGGHLVRVKVPYNLDLSAGTTYRLRVDTLDGNAAGGSASTVPVGTGGGHKGFALRVADGYGPGAAECATCSIGAINELSFYTPLSSNASGGPSGCGSGCFEIPIVNVPATYAGQTINFYAFDPGDVSGTNYLDIVNGQNDTVVSDPAVRVYDLGVNKATPPASATVIGSGPQARVLTAQGGTLYNGHWLLFTVPVPASYNPPDLTHQYWKLRYELTGGTATDTLTVAVGFNGPPVHLIPNP